MRESSTSLHKGGALGECSLARLSLHSLGGALTGMLSLSVFHRERRAFLGSRLPSDVRRDVEMVRWPGQSSNNHFAH